MPGPILIFDSGVGGLSVLAAIRALLPAAAIVYASDNAGFPYGAKSPAELAARVPALLGRLVERTRPAIVVIACNTASVIALAHVRAALDLPVVGTVPAIKPAALATRTGVIGVLGTAATVAQPYVDDLTAAWAPHMTVLRHGAPALVAAAEAHLRGHPPDPEILRAALDGLLGQPQGERMDTVVLACTHFPLLKDQLAAAAPRPLRFVDGNAGIARRTASLLGPDYACAPVPDPAPGRAIATAMTPDLDALRPALRAHGLDTLDLL